MYSKNKGGFASFIFSSSLNFQSFYTFHTLSISDIKIEINKAPFREPYFLLYQYKDSFPGGKGKLI